MTTRSQAIVRYSAPAASNTVIYTCPQSEIALIKETRLTFVTTVAMSWQVWVAIPVVGTYVIISAGSTSVDENVSVTSWLVLEPGDQIAFFNSAGSANVWISGALLPLASQ